VNVTIKLAAAVTKTYNVPTGNIIINGLAEGLNARFVESTISVTVAGTESSLSELSQNLITGYVDAEGLKTGSHTLNVSFNLDEQYHASSEVITVEIEKPGETTSGQQQNQNNNTSSNTNTDDNTDNHTESDSNNNSDTTE